MTVACSVALWLRNILSCMSAPIERISVNGIEVTWDTETGVSTCGGLPVATLWIDSTMSGLMAGMQAMVGTERFGLALQAEGRNSVEDDWRVISQFPKFEDGFEAIAQVAIVAGWGRWELVSIDTERKECRFRVRNSWEAGYQKSLGVAWGSNMLAGKLAGYCTKLFGTNCWADQQSFLAKGDAYDEFLVHPSERSVEREIEGLLETDEATRADMAVAIKRLAQEIEERKKATKERLELEEQVQHAQKLESLGVLAGGIAHDFNNLLVSIMGHADLGRLRVPEGAPVVKNLEAIASTAQRAAELCKQLLAYSGKGRFVLDILDLSHEMQEIGQLLEVSVSKKTRLNYQFKENLPRTEGDRTQIRQIFMNLLTNASESLGGATGTVTIGTGEMWCDREYLETTVVDDELPEGQFVYVEVADTGSGMSTETQDRIFDPFFTTKFTGRGLGLAAVLGIIRGHKGAIKIHSVPDQGTTIRVLLPASSKELVKPPAPPSTSTTSFSGLALLVDDECEVRDVAEMMLVHMGFEVLVAIDGREALRLYDERRDEVSLVLCDLLMPNMDGSELFQALRKRDKDVCVIMSSGYNEQDVCQRHVGDGPSGFIQKPYRLAELTKVIESVLRDRQ